jgi:hypothetical protein
MCGMDNDVIGIEGWITIEIPRNEGMSFSDILILLRLGPR